ncbi:putative transporter [Escovopsis weberi]|uniref:Putative transporter n=1 Tax=Escovopsis weberi TaxID=150374 RepID=A0A0M8MRV0_ESCWE|nr:putative transporter [Escovopsis weberi]
MSQYPKAEDADVIHLESRGDAGKGQPDASHKSPDSAKKTKGGGGGRRVLRGRDKAAQFLKEADLPPIVVTPNDNKRVLRKIDLHILPFILIVYCLQSLDKTALSYASVFGIIEDTHLVGEQFSWLSSVVYVTQLVFQPLIAYGLVKFPVGKFCSVMVLCWGAVLCAMTAAHDFGGLMASRLLLGTFEASVAPSFIAIVQMWYRRREQTLRNASWYAMLGVVNMVGSLLSYGLGHIKSSVLRPYQIIFLFCGGITVLFSIVMFLFMPDSPLEAKFLDKHEKLVAVERLRMNQMGISSGVWKWDHVWESMLDPKTWLWFSLMLAISGGISTFGPLIVQSFGFEPFIAIIFYIPFGFVELVAILFGAWLSDRIRMKSVVLLLLSLPPIVGTVMLLVTGRGPGDRAVLLTGFYIVSVYPAISPLILSWAGQNTAGDTKRKMTTAVLFVGSSVGNIVGPQLFKPSESPRYDRGLRASLALFVVVAVLVIVGMMWIKILNRRHAATRKAMGKAEVIRDISMMGDKQRAAAAAADQDDGFLNQGEERIGDKAFEDVTDLRNEEFIFVL